jgi:hypothetical protein
MINLLCYTCSSAGVALRELFTAVGVSIQDDRPTLKEAGNAKATLQLAVMRRTKKVVFLEVLGKEVRALDIQRMMSLAIGANEVLGAYI